MARVTNFVLDYEGSQASADIQQRTTTRPNASALQLDCTVARSGHCSLRATVSARSDSISAGAYRAESDTMNLRATHYSPGETLCYRFSFLLPQDWAIGPTSAIDILWQFKRFNSRPDMFVAAKGDALVLRVGANAQVLMMKPLPLAHWLDISMEVHWAADESGWVRGEITEAATGESWQFAYSGPTTWNDRAQAAYLKWGLYKPGKTDGSFNFPTRKVWHDEIRVTSGVRSCINSSYE